MDYKNWEFFPPHGNQFLSTQNQEMNVFRDSPSGQDQSLQQHPFTQALSPEERQQQFTFQPLQDVGKQTGFSPYQQQASSTGYGFYHFPSTRLPPGNQHFPVELNTNQCHVQALQKRPTFSSGFYGHDPQPLKKANKKQKTTFEDEVTKFLQKKMLGIDRKSVV